MTDKTPQKVELPFPESRVAFCGLSAFLLFQSLDFLAAGFTHQFAIENILYFHDHIYLAAAYSIAAAVCMGLCCSRLKRSAFIVWPWILQPQQKNLRDGIRFALWAILAVSAILLLNTLSSLTSGPFLPLLPRSLSSSGAEPFHRGAMQVASLSSISFILYLCTRISFVSTGVDSAMQKQITLDFERHAGMYALLENPTYSWPYWQLSFADYHDALVYQRVDSDDLTRPSDVFREVSGVVTTNVSGILFFDAKKIASALSQQVVVALGEGISVNLQLKIDLRSEKPAFFALKSLAEGCITWNDSSRLRKFLQGEFDRRRGALTADGIGAACLAIAGAYGSLNVAIKGLGCRQSEASTLQNPRFDICEEAFLGAAHQLGESRKLLDPPLGELLGNPSSPWEIDMNELFKLHITKYDLIVITLEGSEKSLSAEISQLNAKYEDIKAVNKKERKDEADKEQELLRISIERNNQLALEGLRGAKSKPIEIQAQPQLGVEEKPTRSKS